MKKYVTSFILFVPLFFYLGRKILLSVCVCALGKENDSYSETAASFLYSLNRMWCAFSVFPIDNRRRFIERSSASVLFIHVFVPRYCFRPHRTNKTFLWSKYRLEITLGRHLIYLLMTTKLWIIAQMLRIFSPPSKIHSNVSKWIQFCSSDLQLRVIKLPWVF